MTSNWEKALAVVGFITILSVVGPLLWMSRNLGEMSTEKMTEGLEEILLTLADPAIVLTVVVFLAISAWSALQSNWG